MRILHVIPSVAARDGGPSEAIGPMCAALRGRGIEVSLLSTNADGADSLDVPLGQPTTWQDVPAWFFRRDASEAFKYSRHLAHWVRAQASSFDLVHIHAVLSHAPLAAAAACRAAGVPYVVRPLGTLATWSLSQKPWRKRVLLAAAGKRMLREAAAIHYTSVEERDDTEKRLSLPRGVVIPLGITLPDLDPLAADGRVAEPYVLFLSRLHPKKRVESLIDAYAAARLRTGRPWRLLIAGDGEPSYVQALHARVAAAGVDSVHFLGWVSGAQKQSLLAGASLFALPSQHENFGVSVLEAMASRVAVVISTQVSLASPVAAAKAGWIIDPELQSLTASLAAAMTDDAERRRRARAAHRLAASYSWPRVAEQIEALYLEVCDHQARRSTPRRAGTATFPLAGPRAKGAVS